MIISRQKSLKHQKLTLTPCKNSCGNEHQVTHSHFPSDLRSPWVHWTAQMDWASSGKDLGLWTVHVTFSRQTSLLVSLLLGPHEYWLCADPTHQ